MCESRINCTRSSRDAQGVRHACAYRPKGEKKAVLPTWINCSQQQYYPSYNISPQSNTPVLLSGHHNHVQTYQKDCLGSSGADGVESVGERVLQTMKWGLIPSWHKGTASSFGTILNNCRYETMLEKPSFRNSVQKGRRCVMVADGFYEWYRGKGQRQPHFIYFEDHAPTEEMMEISAAAQPVVQDAARDCEVVVKKPANIWEHPTGRMLTMAGLFDIWRPEPTADPLFTYTVITVEAHARFAHIHDRMPAILDGQDIVQTWLDPSRTPRELMSLLHPTDCLHWHPVSSVVNNSRNNSPDCVLPTDPTSSQKSTLLNWFSKSPHPRPPPLKKPRTET